MINAVGGEQGRTGGIGILKEGMGKLLFLCGVVGGGFVIKVTFEHRSKESEAKFRFYS